MSDKLRFGEMLVRAGVLGRDDLERVLAEVSAQDIDLGEVLVAKGLVDEASMLKTLSKALNLPCVSLDQIVPEPRALQLVPRELCVEHHLLPVEVERSRTGEHLHVAMANPSDVKAIKRVTRQARLRIRPLIASAREIHAAIQRHYGGPAIPVLAAQPSGSVELAGPSPEAAGGPTPETTNFAIGGAGAGAMFDFGVTDLSALGDDEASGTFSTSSVGAAPPGIDLMAPADFGELSAPPDLAPPPALDQAPPPELPPPPDSRGGLGGGVDLAAPLMGPAQIEPAPQLDLSTPPPGAPGMGRGANPPDQLGSDLVDALDTSDTTAMISTSDLGGAMRPAFPATATGDAFGYVRRTRRQRTGERSPEGRGAGPPPTDSPREMPRQPPLPSRTTVGPAAKKPLPPLPPNLRGRREASLEPDIVDLAAPSGPPPQVVPEAIMETMMAPLRAPPELSAPPPEPEGLVDDPGRRSVAGMLDRYATDDSVDGEDDTVIAEVAGRYGGPQPATSTPVPAGDPLGALDRAAQSNPEGAARVLVTLVTHLARRGVIDPEELLNELHR